MPRYAAFFGSINVGGNRLSMADLREVMQREGFATVETVVASGNLLFDHDERPRADLERKLAYIVSQRFAITSFAAVRSRDALAETIAANPFAADGEEARVHSFLLSAPPEAAAFAQLCADHAGRGRERLALSADALHVDFVDGVAGSKLTNAFIERRLGCRATARNLRSLRRILTKMDA